MSNPELQNKITYIEFITSDIEATKKFYGTVFGWSFQDWGPDYIDIDGAGIPGGFAKGEPQKNPDRGGPVVVLYSTDLKATQEAIVAAGGSVVVPTFEFPGGRRFHFADGLGNVLGVWSE